MTIELSEGLLARIAEDCGFQVVGSKLLPGKEAIYKPVPAQLPKQLFELLVNKFPEGLYGHQVDAIEAGLNGENICLATSTASGKSLVFINVAANILIHNPDAKIIAFYPVKALIQDQLAKWAEVLDTLNIAFTYIDGTVPMRSRMNLIRENQLILMTPDVCHSWMMSNVGQVEIKDFFKSLELIILDESHVYEGIFGTNMAFFLRRLRALAGDFQIIVSTGTLDSPDQFFTQLTGKIGRTFSLEDDCSKQCEKDILLARVKHEKPDISCVKLLKILSGKLHQQFLVFSDSRKKVEQYVAETNKELTDKQILPYRAGYENQDRQSIQDAFVKGELTGVVSTSALEVGIDIGAIDLVVLLGKPWSFKAFMQRLGRAGRKQNGYCLFCDTDLSVKGIDSYLRNTIEPNILYLDNKYLQYTNALCTAVEMKLFDQESYHLNAFEDIPDRFRNFLDNEVNPKGPVPSDIYPLKQRAQAGPHREFPIRTGMEKNFKILENQGATYGEIAFSQAMREAYPGAVYYYMSRPYRVIRFDYRFGEIHIKPERNYLTTPDIESMIFPRFIGGIHHLLISDEGFVAEVEVQVSQRVKGFTLRRGKEKSVYEYGPTSPYSQRDLSRYYESTGICIYFTNNSYLEKTVGALIEAFCGEFGIREQDIDSGTFISQSSPLGNEKCKGICIYDSTEGSLRFTEKLFNNLSHIINSAISFTEDTNKEKVKIALERLSMCVANLKEGPIDGRLDSPEVNPDDIFTVIEPGQRAIYETKNGQQMEVEIIKYHYTREGIKYEIKRPDIENIFKQDMEMIDDVSVHSSGGKWIVPSDVIKPLNPDTKLINFNSITGDETPIN